MTHADIQVGDVVYDLAGDGAKLVIVDRLADSIEEHRAQEGVDYDIGSYKSHPHLPVRESDPVFECVFVPDTPGGTPSKTYDFPAGRLARAPIEAADEDLEHVRDTIVRDALEELLAMASTIDSTGTVDGSYVDVLLDVAGEALDERLVRHAEELARTRHDWQGASSTDSSAWSDDDPDPASASAAGAGDDLGDFDPSG
jgi:hypothetical protein